MRRLKAVGRPAAISLSVVLALGLSATAAQAASVIPIPNEVVAGTGAFAVSAATTVGVPAHDPGAEHAARYLTDLLVRSKRSPPMLADTARTPEADVRFRRRSGFGPEAYELDVTPRGIVISATTDAGLFYGAVTLWQLLTPGGGTVLVPAQTIRDAPAYPWRGLMLDSARHFQPPAFIRSMIDAMAEHKLNVLHWHLTDDQGWRLEIRRYPRLTGIGARRVSAGTGEPYGGYYTQDDVRDIVAYAASRHVLVVPEIEMPGHAQAALAAYPELGVTDAGAGHAPLEVSNRWGVHTHLFNVDPATFTFLENVLAEVMDLFPGPYIHVGGDEAVKDEWNASASVQARAHALGLKDADALQAYFTQTIGNYLLAHGRRPVGWDEILRPGLDKKALVMSWHGTRGAYAAARGNDTILTPWPTLYLDNRQSSLPTEVPGRLDIVSLEDVYQFNPRDPSLSEAARRHVLGVQANAWTEHMQTDSRVQWMTWPRAAAVAELGWSTPERRHWPDFVQRLVPMFDRYRALDIDYADSVYGVAAHFSAGAGGIRVILSNQAAAGEIRYTLDGSDPAAGSTLYTAPFDVPVGASLRAAAFVQSRQASRVVARRLDASSLARRTSHDLEPCSSGVGLLLEPMQGQASFGAPLAVDIMNPCWIERDVDLTHARRLTAAVARLPFNYELGTAAAKIRVGDARTPEGELEIHVDGCDTSPVATLPLAKAATAGVTELPALTLPSRAGHHDVCFRFARPRLDPLWALDWIEMGG
jgi:hexosaminidase